MDGLSLARAIKSDPALAAVSVVRLTSLRERGGADDAQPAGFSAVLLKPIRQSQLYECLTSAMNRKSEPSPTRLLARPIPGDAEARVRAKVLVAEDNAVNQKVAVGMLEKLLPYLRDPANGFWTAPMGAVAHAIRRVRAGKEERP